MAFTTIKNFVAQLDKDRRKMNKPYLYEVSFFNQLPNDLVQMMTLYCHNGNIPGYSTETKRGRIYGLDYEVPINIEQDPIWFSFYSDLNFRVPGVFLDLLRVGNTGMSMFSREDFSPRYKDSHALSTVITILDDEFNVIATILLDKCFFKVVQQMQLDAKGINQVQTVTVQLVYERMKVVTVDSEPDENAKDQIKKLMDERAGATVPGAEAAEDAALNPESTKFGDMIKSVTGPFKAASEAIASARERFNSLGIQEAISQVNQARRAILDPIHQINESRALVTSTIAGINSTVSATALEFRQGATIMTSFDKLF